MRHIKKNHFFILFSLILNFSAFINPAWAAATSGGTSTNTDFQEYFRFQCQDSDGKFNSFGNNFTLCDNVFKGNYAVSLKSENSIGIQPSGDGSAPSGVKGRPAGNVTVGGGSSWGSVSGGDEDIGLGILLTGLSSDTTRQGTELENGFDSKLDGYLLGLDYQMFDSLILGATFGSLDDDADIAANGGTFKTESDSKTIYATWVPLENLSLDFYYGQIDSDTDTKRNFSFSSDSFSVEGLITGSYGADQDINGFSINYDWYLGGWLIGAFAAMDSVDTTTEAYNEEGDTGFELGYPEQKIKSETESLGLRIGYSVEFGWGVVQPVFKTMSVNENENDSRIIPISFASTVSSGDVPPFTAQTDAPDRDYTTSSFGIIAAFNNGSQIFLDYEERSGHDFIDTSSTTLGALIAF